MAVKHSLYLLIVLLVLGALVGSVLVQPAPASAANEWYVSVSGSDLTGDGSDGNPWRTINHAIADPGVLDGDTIYVRPGWYYEQVELTRPLSIIGAGVNPNPSIGTFIASPLTDNFTYTVGGNTYDYVIVAHDSVNIWVAAMTVVAREGPGFRNAPLIFDNVTGASGFGAGCVSGWNSENIAWFDIAIFGGSNVGVSNSQIVDCNGSSIYNNDSTVRIETNQIVNEVAGTCCIEMNNAPSTSFIQSNFLSATGDGIYLRNCSNVNINGNDISGHGVLPADGIYCFDCTGPITITRNVIYDFLIGGIVESAGGRSVTGSVVNNEIYDCATGIDFGHPGSNWTSIADNLIYDCTVKGLSHACALASVTGNIFYNDVIGIKSANDLTAHCNAILGNTTAGLDIQADV